VGFAAGWAQLRPPPQTAADESLASSPPEIASSPPEIAPEIASSPPEIASSSPEIAISPPEIAPEIASSPPEIAAPLAVCIQPLLALLDPRLPTPQPDSTERMHASYALRLLASCGEAFSGQMLRKGALAQLSATIRMSPTPTHGRCRTSPCNAPCAASQPCCVTSAAATTLERLSDCLTPGSRRAVMSLHPLAIESAHGSAHGSAEGAERRWRRRSSAPLVPSALGRAPSLPM